MLSVKFVEYIPDDLEDNILYISQQFLIAIHKCCCGCGISTVTPLSQNGWSLTIHENGLVSLDPSIGNFQFPCKSHYYIKENEVYWIT